MPETNARIKVCHDTAANFKTNNPTLLVGEWALETDTKKMKIGDGVTAYNSLDYFRDEDNEWEKPAEWIDIRSAALPNSVYFLVGHSADYSQYPVLDLYADISNSGTYDVYIDGRKLFTTNSGTHTPITWEDLALTSGWDVTYPKALRTHVVRVTPTVSTNTISSIQTQPIEAYSDSGILWVHFTITNTISILWLLGHEANRRTAPLCEAVTSSTGEILISNKTYPIGGAFSNCWSLKTIPILNLGNRGVHSNETFRNCGIQIVRLKNGYIFSSPFQGDDGKHPMKIKRIETDNAGLGISGSEIYYARNLEEIPPLFPMTSGSSEMRKFIVGLSGLKKDAVIDVSSRSNCKILGIFDTPKVKSVVVSNEAPFDSTTSPQLNVSNTGLDRAALVNLFKSMPYNVGYTMVGNPTIVDGVVSGFTEDDNIKMSLPFPQKNKFEQVIKFKVNSGATGAQNIFAGTGMSLRVSSNAITFRLQDYQETTQALVAKSDYTLGTDIWVKITYDGVTSFKTFSSTDGENYIAGDDATFTPYNRAPTIFFGKSGSSTLNGSIDLNGTYINVNGIPWFRGTAAMTKTVSVVGCTGTADLTAADKAIAEDKGWAITLS